MANLSAQENTPTYGPRFLRAVFARESPAVVSSSSDEGNGKMGKCCTAGVEMKEALLLVDSDRGLLHKTHKLHHSLQRAQAQHSNINKPKYNKMLRGNVKLQYVEMPRNHQRVLYPPPRTVKSIVVRRQSKSSDSRRCVLKRLPPYPFSHHIDRRSQLSLGIERRQPREGE